MRHTQRINNAASVYFFIETFSRGRQRTWHFHDKFLTRIDYNLNERVMHSSQYTFLPNVIEQHH